MFITDSDHKFDGYGTDELASLPSGITTIPSSSRGDGTDENMRCSKVAYHPTV